MRKTILMLINGFGIERKGSIEVYNQKLMPNLDALSKSYLFGSLTTGAGDYNNGYHLFGLKEKDKKAQDKIDDMIYEKTLPNNEVLKSISNSLTDQNKLHVFYVMETGSKFHQVKEFLKVINPNKDKKVFIHIIMSATSTTYYSDIVKTISKISFESSEYGKIGFIVGKNKINTDDTLRTFYKEYGERWNESTKKFDILNKEIVNPEDANIFYINPGFALQEGDSVFFLNFEEVAMDRFYDDFTKVKVNQFSLFEFKSGVPNAFVKEKGDASSFADTVEQFGIKILVLTSQDRINDVNFYLNGMMKKNSPNITYAINDIGLFATKEAVINLVDGNNYDGIILDFNIGSFNQLADIKNTLSQIDSIIKPISDASLEKDYTLIISSLYGMYAQIMDGVVPKVINFSMKVPCVFQSNTFNRSGFSLNSGDINGLAGTFLTNICDEVKSNKLVHQLSKVEKMLSKK